MNLSILYRGMLCSCNYGCEYCPFAKRRETRAELAADERDLHRFVDWVARQPHRISVLFTPWGEALIRKSYQDALVSLTNLPNVDKAAIQTNLTCRLDWTNLCNLQKLGLWCTYHPGETTRAEFLKQCRELDSRNVAYSVGIVGLTQVVEEAEALRRELRPDVYFWINAYKRSENYYKAEDLSRFEAIDPLFPINNTRHASKGRACRAGHTVISVAGDGTIRRCHFIKEPLGNIYESGFENILQPNPCTNQTCGCHIGYVHLEHLKLYERFGSGVLARIPAARSV
jgi:MoaA/NifB/PqqE/SkfB family radical SAM enzyme